MVMVDFLHSGHYEENNVVYIRVLLLQWGGIARIKYSEKHEHCRKT
jgi:hypothetical protein